jgi:septum formation protein
MPKAHNDDEVRFCLRLLSGRRHKVFSGVCVLKVEDNTVIAKRSKLVTSTVKFKRLSEQEIELYVASKQGLNKSAACAIEGLCGIFVEYISGSFSNIIGLPLFEAYHMLSSVDYVSPKQSIKI